MCPEKFLTRPRGTMKMDLFKRAVDEIAAIEPATEVWAPIMGEVFLMGERIFDYVEYAKHAGLKNVYLNSNLVLFDERMITRLDSSGLDKLTVGVDAATAATHDKIRIDKRSDRKTNFEKLNRNIEALISAKKNGRLANLEVVLQFIVQEENAHEEELFKEKWRGSGLTLKIRPKLGWGTAICADNLQLSNENRSVPCPWLMRTMSIHWTGKVAQCDAMWNGEHYVGDLAKQTIKEVWLGELQDKRDRHLRNDFDFDPCRDCKDWQCGLSEVIRGH